MARPVSKNEWLIYDRGGIWQVDLRKAGGKRFSSGLDATRANRKQLEVEVIPMLLSKLKGEATDTELIENFQKTKSATSIEVFGAQSLSRHGVERQSHVQHSYELVWKKHILPFFGKKKLENINGLDIVDWQNQLNQKSGFATVKKARIMLTQMFNDALIAGYIQKSPMLGTKLPKRLSEEREIMPFSMAELELLLSTADGYFRNIIGVLAFTGMRPGELCALEWVNVSFETKEISIKQTIKRDRSIGATKTKSGNRVVEMLPIVEKFLRNQFLLTGLKGGMVFQSKVYKKGFTSIDYLQRAFNDIQKQCGIIQRNLYQLRHTFASMMLRNGEDLLWVSANIGHKAPDITLKCYAKHIKTERKIRASWLSFSHSFSHTGILTGQEAL